MTNASSSTEGSVSCNSSPVLTHIPPCMRCLCRPTRFWALWLGWANFVSGLIYCSYNLTLLNLTINIIPPCLDVVTWTEQTRTKLLATQNSSWLCPFLVLSKRSVCPLFAPVRKCEIFSCFRLQFRHSDILEWITCGAQLLLLDPSLDPASDTSAL